MDAKLIRGQLRQIAKELLPALCMKEEHKAIVTNLNAQIEGLKKIIESRLDEIDARSRDMQAYIVRNVTMPSVNPTIPENIPTYSNESRYGDE
jgi:hypothetical protein